MSDTLPVRTQKGSNGLDWIWRVWTREPVGLASFCLSLSIVLVSAIMWASASPEFKVIPGGQVRLMPYAGGTTIYLPLEAVNTGREGAILELSLALPGGREFFEFGHYRPTTDAAGKVKYMVNDLVRGMYLKASGAIKTVVRFDHDKGVCEGQSQGTSDLSAIEKMTVRTREQGESEWSDELELAVLFRGLECRPVASGSGYQFVNFPLREASDGRLVYSVTQL